MVNVLVASGAVAQHPATVMSVAVLLSITRICPEPVPPVMLMYRPLRSSTVHPAPASVAVPQVPVLHVPAKPLVNVPEATPVAGVEVALVPWMTK